MASDYSTGFLDEKKNKSRHETLIFCKAVEHFSNRNNLDGFQAMILQQNSLKWVASISILMYRRYTAEFLQFYDIR